MGICCYLPDPQANSRLDRGGGSEQNSSEGDDPEAPLSLIFSRRGGPCKRAKRSEKVVRTSIR
jgi:hypothetical protein